MNWKHTLAMLAGLAVLVTACENHLESPLAFPDEEEWETEHSSPSGANADILESIREIEAVLDTLRGPRGRAVAAEWNYDFDQLVRLQESALAAFKSDLRPWTPADHIENLTTLIGEATEAGNTKEAEGLAEIRRKIERQLSESWGFSANDIVSESPFSGRGPSPCNTALG